MASKAAFCLHLSRQNHEAIQLIRRIAHRGSDGGIPIALPKIAPLSQKSCDRGVFPMASR